MNSTLSIRVRPDRGEPFDVEVGNLTSGSAFLKTERSFRFRERLVLEFGDTSVRGEVVYLATQPPLGVGLQLEVPPSVRPVIEAFAKAMATGGPFPQASPAPEEPRLRRPTAVRMTTPIPGRPPPASAASAPATGPSTAASAGLSQALKALPSVHGADSPVSVEEVSGDISAYVFDLPLLPEEELKPSEDDADPRTDRDLEAVDVLGAATGTDRLGTSPPKDERALLESSVDIILPATDDLPPLPRSSIPRDLPPAIGPETAADRQNVTTGSIVMPSLLEVTEDGRLQLTTQFEAYAVCTMLLAQSPIVARVSQPLDRVALFYRSTKLELKGFSIGDGLIALVGKDRIAIEKAVEYLKEPSPTGDLPKNGSSKEPDPWDVPVLAPDGSTIHFQSRAHYNVQFRTNIAQGAIVAKAPAMPLGSRRTLRLEIRDRPDSITLDATVSFLQDGVVGFVIQGFAAHKASLMGFGEARAQPQASSRPDPISPRMRPSFAFRAPLKSQGSLKEILEFSERQPETLDDCNGWFVRILDFLFRSKDHSVCMFRENDRRLTVWIQRGRVSFTRLESRGESQLLGHKLVTEKKVTRKLLEQAVQRAKAMNEPLGRTLVNMGAVQRSQLNAALRSQVAERLLSIREWGRGEVEVMAWTDPQMTGDLVATQGSSLISTLLREQIRCTPMSEVEAMLQPWLDRVVKVAAAAKESTSVFSQKEIRAIEIAADTPQTLRGFPIATGLSLLSAMRLVVLGKALGLIEIGGLLKEVSANNRELETLQSLREQVTAMEKGNLFDVLGLHWTSSEADIGAGHEARMRELRDHRRSSQPEIRALANRAAELAKRAFSELSDAKLRTSYRSQIADPAERKRTADLMLDRVETLITTGDVLHAELVLRASQEIFPTKRGIMLWDQIGPQSRT